MSENKLEYFFSYLRGLVVSKSKEMSTLTDVNSVLSILRHEAQIETAYNELKDILNENVAYDLKNHKLRWEIHQLTRQLRKKEIEYSKAIERIKELMTN